MVIVGEATISGARVGVTVGWGVQVDGGIGGEGVRIGEGGIVDGGGTGVTRVIGIVGVKETVGVARVGRPLGIGTAVVNTVVAVAETITVLGAAALTNSVI